jgi:hypothetical protein
MTGEDRPDDVRAEAERHIAEHSLGEAARIGRLSRIREFVLGAQDGLLVPLGVVTGMAAAHPARSLMTRTALSNNGSGVSQMARYKTGSAVSKRADLPASAGRADPSTSRRRSSHLHAAGASSRTSRTCRSADMRSPASSRASETRTQDT